MKFTFNKSFVVVSVIAIVLTVGLFGYFFFVRVNKDFTFEYGEEITIDMLVNSNLYDNIEVLDDLSLLKEVGDYSVRVILDNKEYTFNISIRDTVAPTLSVQDLVWYVEDGLPTVEDFVVEASDLSEFSFNEISFFNELGEYEIEIVATDVYGNATTKKVILTNISDNEGPVFSGLSNLIIEMGTSSSLTAGVSAVDEHYGEVSFTVDDSNVLYNHTGSYVIYYEATDELGNTTVEERTVLVVFQEGMYIIEDFPTYNQYPNYPNGCEMIALYNLLTYYGISVDPEELAEKLVKGSSPYWYNNVLYGGNPEIEFVGDPRSSSGYGVYQKPIMELASYYKSGMVDYTGHSLDDVLELVSVGIPVQVWVSINLEDTSVCASWIHPLTGITVNWICDLHSVILIGYSDTEIYVSDSYTGNIESYDKTQFEKMYNLFGKRALYFPT